MDGGCVTPRVRSPDADRGQTLPDFAVGVAVFLLTIAFVSAFVPQLMVAFDGQERPVVAERFASDLRSDRLTVPDSQSELNETDTRSFFNQSSTDALEQLGAASWYSLNVTLRDGPSRDANSEILCAGSEDEWWITDCGADAERFAVGESVPRNERSVATAQRTLFAVDTAEDRTEYVILEVSIW